MTTPSRYPPPIISGSFARGPYSCEVPVFDYSAFYKQDGAPHEIVGDINKPERAAAWAVDHYDNYRYTYDERNFFQRNCTIL